MKKSIIDRILEADSISKLNILGPKLVGKKVRYISLFDDSAVYEVTGIHHKFGTTVNLSRKTGLLQLWRMSTKSVWIGNLELVEKQ